MFLLGQGDDVVLGDIELTLSRSFHPTAAELLHPCWSQSITTKQEHVPVPETTGEDASLT